MKRRDLVQYSIGVASLAAVGSKVCMAALQSNDFQAASEALATAVAEGKLRAGSFYVEHRQQKFEATFGESTKSSDPFLIASISKPISIAALMTLYDRGEFKLEDPVVKFLPAFSQDARREITIKQLLTHTSGLPDQLPENDSLRRRHAPLEDFVQRAMQTPLLFAPGSRYSYSSMGILLASEIAHTITAQTFSQFVRSQIFEPLAMDRTALGLGELQLEETMQCQVEHAAREAGAGDPSTLDWDWNSAYWRNLGAPWGGVHASAADVSKFLRSFLNNSGQCLKPETATLMITNHNDPRFAPRGLGFALGSAAHSPHCSEAVFGHSGSTGTLCWADPATDTVCVVLTTLPAAAGKVHPRQLAADYIARSVV